MEPREPIANVHENVTSSENQKDESNIILDQDQTISQDPGSSSNLMGAEGKDNPPLADTEDFVRGEVDLVDQMDRAIKIMDTAAGRKRIH